MSEERHGYFGAFGGQFMPETLMNAVIELEEAYNKYKDDPEFVRELEDLHKKYTGRPSLLYYACLLYTSPSPRDGATSRMPSSA